MKYATGQTVYMIHMGLPRHVCHCEYLGPGPQHKQHRVRALFHRDEYVTHDDWLFANRADACNRLRALKELNK